MRERPTEQIDPGPGFPRIGREDDDIVHPPQVRETCHDQRLVRHRQDGVSEHGRRRGSDGKPDDPLVPERSEQIEDCANLVVGGARITKARADRPVPDRPVAVADIRDGGDRGPARPQPTVDLRGPPGPRGAPGRERSPRVEAG